MNLRELELLLALCTSASMIKELPDAERLATQLSTYLPEAHTQVFAESPFLSEISPSPWAVVTFQLTNALLQLGTRFITLRTIVSECMQSYLSSWTQAANALAWQAQGRQSDDEELEAREVAAVAVSLVGFMEAAAMHYSFWDAHERLEFIKTLKDSLTENFLVAVETASSAIRHSNHHDLATRDWKKYLRRYAAKGNPLGAMLLQKGFMRMVLSCTARMLCDEHTVECGDLLDQYIGGTHLDRADEEVTEEMIEYLAELISDQMRALEDGFDYLQLSSAWQQRLAFSVKAYALEAFLHCMVLDEDIADAEILFGWLEDSLDNQVQMADIELADVVLKCFGVVAKYMPESTANFARVLLRFVVQGTSSPNAVTIAAQSLSHVLRSLSQDAVITTLYSLGNILSSQSGTEKAHHPLSPSPDGHHNSVASAGRLRTGSVISLSVSGDEETSLVCGNVAHAVVMVATSCNDTKITALAQTMMLQKVGRVSVIVDARIIEETAVLSAHGKESEFRALLRLHSRLHHEALKANNTLVSDAVRKAREYLALNLDNKSPLFKIFALHLLEVLLSKGDVVEGEFKQSAEVEQAAKEIAPLLKPLAILAVRKAPPGTPHAVDQDPEMNTMAREAWYNIAVHGITLQSRIGQQYYHELRVLSMHSAPLVDEERVELLESDVELNTILRRGMSQQHTSDQRKSLTSIISEREADIKHLSYQKVVYLNAVYLVESLRATSGECAEMMEYFVDPALQSSEMGRCLTAIAGGVVKRYTQKVLPAEEDEFSAPYVSRQLAKIFSACCHRSKKMQDVARASAESLISAAPSALIQKAALFALLELLTLMWSSCIEEDLDEYEWRSEFTSARGKITIELSDNYGFRKQTLNSLYISARRWVTTVMAIAPLDVKGLLQTYLSEYDDTGAYGHVSLGRSFALEIGALIPPMDQRLGAIDRTNEVMSINVASDFVAQYTTRQEYRFAGIPDHGQIDVRADIVGIRDGTASTSKSIAEITADSERLLARIQEKTDQKVMVPTSELKDVLRRAAAVLCTSKRSQTAIVHFLVTIPFELFSKDPVRLGISLWLGVIHENPRMEPRILTEVAQAWERTIERRVGIFNHRFRHPDPFYLKEEFAPSDKEFLQKQIQLAQNTISPHLRVLQFFQSHFNAIRLGSANTQRTFIRMMDRTLRGFMQITGHPLLREMQFHVVLFALRLLRFGTCFSNLSLWRLKDQAISVGLRWFAQPPLWSFGGNRLQMKAEIQLMQDVVELLRSVGSIGNSTSANRKDASEKQVLLMTLLENEIYRLSVWLQPMFDGHHSFHSGQGPTSLARTAWAEDPSLAIQLVTRWPNDEMKKNVRVMLLNFPQKALSEANGVDLLVGDTLPNDVSVQLKYLLYWTPVNPVQAATYFLPAFGNHPFIIQYAMRALESHSVDVTFFYVPQIVQALRYDALGYVERYIIETGKFSQLFAHQIIWNLNANAYKDDEGTEPDPLKPTFDKVTESLINSFSGEDKAFYEREFAFFGEVTGISGKLKPFIKKSKPEKKQKIEEELRKIKVEVGVYLPSNPDGVVVGIDRKSGKPLQSHAKAPYMATFRIRKQRDAPTEDDTPRETDGKVVKRQASPRPMHTRTDSSLSITYSENTSNTYEIWQSAIFKVGDDCRQDILALQMIAAFRGIFNSVGLDVYVYPYRVTATAPGCGVIDVLPNSISRDMLGREAVNGLHDYFITKYGGEHSVRYQQARAEFVKSMAAYSVISYLMQFKDRHNGNIMVDDKGHILHIDFGFCFDISPGGVRFERAPFKLTEEMIAVMGGDDPAHSQSYRWFQELTIKAFLCSRQYSSKLCHLVELMLDSGLPCFKPETMSNFRGRFRLDLGEREAGTFMWGCIKKSEANVTTKVYDEFQLLTNGIPY